MGPDVFIHESIVLLTGFEPFDMYEVNPSQLIVEALNGTSINGTTIVNVVFPVDFNESVAITTHMIETYDPILVISIGLAPKATSIEIEKCGINLKCVQRDDGTWSFPHRIDPSGSFVRFSPFPVRDIVLQIRNNDIPAHMSLFAGTYVCNALLYGELGYIEDHHLPIKTGFIHVPLRTSQNPQGMDLQTMIDAVQIAIEMDLSL